MNSNVYVIFPTIGKGFSFHSVSIFIQMLQLNFSHLGQGQLYTPEWPPSPIAGCESRDFWLKMMLTAIVSNFCLLAAHVS